MRQLNGIELYSVASSCLGKLLKFNKILNINILRQKHGGGGGSRTRVPCAFIRGIYMLSFEFVVVAEAPRSGLFSSQALECTADE